MKKDKLGMALIGAGLWGQAHAEVYAAHPYARLVAVCDLDEQRARQTAQAFGAAHFTDYQQMLTRDDIDAVAVATPDFAHVEPILAAIATGKHVLCEKPLCTTREDARKIAQAVAAAAEPLQVSVDFHNRWNPPVHRIKDDIAAGTIGKVISAYIRFNDTIYVPTEMLSWAAQSSILWFLGSHTVDMLHWLLDTRTKRVFAVSRSEVLAQRGIDTPDVYQAILEFENGAVATIENGWIVPNSNPGYNDYKINVTGARGMFNMDFSHHQMLQRFLPDRWDHPDVMCRTRVQGKPTGLGYESIRDFVDRLYRGRPPVVTLAEAVRVTEVILAIMESARKGRPVEVRYMPLPT